MSRWFIGCGIVLVILIGILIAGGLFIAREVREIHQTASVAGDLLDDVEAAYPFTIPSDRLLDPQRVEAFLQARERLARFALESTEATNEGSFLSRVQSGVGAFQADGYCCRFLKWSA